MTPYENNIREYNSCFSKGIVQDRRDGFLIIESTHPSNWDLNLKNTRGFRSLNVESGEVLLIVVQSM